MTVPSACSACAGSPCVCHYLDRLGSGALDDRIVSLALDRAGIDHDFALTCPCPECYRSRLATWEAS